MWVPTLSTPEALGSTPAPETKTKNQKTQKNRKKNKKSIKGWGVSLWPRVTELESRLWHLQVTPLGKCPWFWWEDLGAPRARVERNTVCTIPLHLSIRQGVVTAVTTRGCYEGYINRESAQGGVWHVVHAIKCQLAAAAESCLFFMLL